MYLWHHFAGGKKKIMKKLGLTLGFFHQVDRNIFFAIKQKVSGRTLVEAKSMSGEKTKGGRKDEKKKAKRNRKLVYS